MISQVPNFITKPSAHGIKLWRTTQDPTDKLAPQSKHDHRTKKV